MIITLAGKSGSGKTTLAEVLATARHAPRAGFGDYVRHLAMARGLDVTQRTVLQNLGHDLVKSDAPKFLEDALAWGGHRPGCDLVLDGLRHVEILAALRARAGKVADPMVLAYLETPVAVRHARLAARGANLAEITISEAHPAELDVSCYLRSAADLVMTGDRPAEVLAAELLEFVDAR